MGAPAFPTTCVNALRTSEAPNANIVSRFKGNFSFSTVFCVQVPVLAVRKTCNSTEATIAQATWILSAVRSFALKELLLSLPPNQSTPAFTRRASFPPAPNRSAYTVSSVTKAVKEFTISHSKRIESSLESLQMIISKSIIKNVSKYHSWTHFSSHIFLCGLHLSLSKP